MDKEILESKFLGSLVGTAVGDALGMPVEGWSLDQIESRYGEIREMLDGRLPAGHYTDDTEMMIGVAESLIENRGFDGERMAQRFINNYNAYRGYGFGPSRVFSWIKSGEAWNKASERLFDSGSYGNGGAMRISPIGLYYCEDPEKLRSIANQASQITHAHELGKEGATLQAYAVALAVNNDPHSSPLVPCSYLRRMIEFTENAVYKRKLKCVEMLLGERTDRSRVVAELGNGIEAFNSVPTAIYSFLSHPDSFEEAVVYAVGLGGDTDTLGAMTGAVSGAYHGIDSIPDRWRNRLENLAYLKELAGKLWHLKKEIYHQQETTRRLQCKKVLKRGFRKTHPN
ncbi:MAG: hypothetical protein GTN80_10900 [Nitrososphaeria archaeon]|nr:hypothetical protein [Nitrososphaeria archaeon]NIQ34126.1 hypothetical protein [Nitrososphaeria archaeon]